MGLIDFHLEIWKNKTEQSVETLYLASVMSRLYLEAFEFLKTKLA